MKFNMGITHSFKQFMAIALSVLLGQPTYAVSVSSENQQMAFEGTLTDTSGNPISLAGVTLNFYISANGCYLYGESSSTSGDSQGNIMHRFGSGTMAAGSPNTFSQNLFFGTVTGTTTFAGNNCSVTASDVRVAQVYYPAQNITGTIKLGTVPYAQNATTLDGKVSTDFVQVSSDSATLFSGGSTGQYLTKGASGLTWTTQSLTSAQISSALGYTPASATVAMTSSTIISALGYTPAASAALTAGQVTTALGYTPANSATLANYVLRSNNLSDITSATAARNNLGLGSLATKSSVNLGNTDVSGTLSAARLPSFSGDVATGVGSSVTTVQALRGVPLSATGPASGQVLVYNGIAWTPTSLTGIGTVTFVSSSNSDISVTSNATTPTLTLNAGTSGGQILRLDSSARIPGVDASLLTNLNAANISSGTLPTQRLPSFIGDISTSTGSNNVTVTRLRGVSISTTAPASGQTLTYNGSQWVPQTPVDMVGVTNVSSSNSDIIVVSNTTTPQLTLNVGTGSNQIIRLDGAGKLPAVDASNLTNIDAADITSGTLAPARLPALSGDVSSTSGSAVVSVTKLRGFNISTSSPTTGQVLTYSGGNWTPLTPNLGTVTNVTAGNGLLGGSITSSGTLSVNFGTTSGSVAAGNDTRIVGALQAASNLSDIVSASAARSNLGLGSLATKSVVNLTSDVSGVLPVANGGSKWTASLGSIYTVSNTTIGSSTAYTSVGLFVAAPTGVSNSIATSINNSAADGFGLKINVDNNSSANYGLRVSTFNTTNFVVLNNGNVGVGIFNPTAKLHIASVASGTAAMKIASGSLLATPQAGAIEYDGTNLYHTNDSNFRRVVATGNNAGQIDNVTKINSSTDMTITAPNGVIVSSTAASSNYQNGALIVKGGLGVNGNGNFNGSVNAANNITASGSITAVGNIATSGSLNVSNNITAAGLITPNIWGNTASGANLTIDSTSHSSKGNIILAGNGGNVGIGTTTPTADLQISNPSGNTYLKLGPTTAANGNAVLQMIGRNSGTSNIAQITADFGGQFTFRTGSAITNLDYDFKNSAGTTSLAIAPSGNVGIGTNSPAYRFQIRSANTGGYSSVLSASSGTAMIGTGEDSNNQLYNVGFDASGLVRWSMTTSGTNYFLNPISIGNTSPLTNSLLSVHGNLSSTGSVSAAGNITTAANLVAGGNIATAGGMAVSKTLVLTGSTTFAPLLFSTTTIAGTPINNSFEYDGSHLFFTNNSGQRRRLAGGAASGTIDNINKLSYSGGTLTLEGSTTGTTASVVINNLNTGTVALQVNDSAVVSGSIKLSTDGSDIATACTASDEGKQRYNKTLKTMEYCDGSFWQGMAGITHCTGSGGVSYTLIGTPGTGSAFCMSRSSETGTSYANAVTTCQNRTTTRNGARPFLCNETNYQMACRQYTTFGANAETNLPGFKNTNYWIPAAYSSTSIFVLQYTTATSNTCNITDMSNTNVSDTSTISYRCCYQ